MSGLREQLKILSQNRQTHNANTTLWLFGIILLKKKEGENFLNVAYRATFRWPYNIVHVVPRRF